MKKICIVLVLVTTSVLVSLNQYEAKNISSFKANIVSINDSDHNKLVPLCGTCIRTEIKEFGTRYIYDRYLGIHPAFRYQPYRYVNYYWFSNNKGSSMSISLSYGNIGISVSSSGGSGFGVYADPYRASKPVVYVSGLERNWEATEIYNATNQIVRKYNYSTFRTDTERIVPIYK